MTKRLNYFMFSDCVNKKTTRSLKFEPKRWRRGLFSDGKDRRRGLFSDGKDRKRGLFSDGKDRKRGLFSDGKDRKRGLFFDGKDGTKVIHLASDCSCLCTVRMYHTISVVQILLIFNLHFH